MAPEKFIDEQYLSKAIGVGTNEDASSHLKNLGIQFSYSKPETVVAFFVRAMTKENDLILDFFIGSGTTAAVAHKMNRRYIGIDQMDYIKDVTVSRLIKVIEGEQGGISKSAGWYGGGSFVYCELAQLNQTLVEKISSAQELESLWSIWENMQKVGFLSWKIDPKIVNENISEFTDLSIEDAKRFLIECLDKNMLYIPIAEIDNSEFEIPKNIKQLNMEFYGKN